MTDTPDESPEEQLAREVDEALASAVDDELAGAQTGQLEVVTAERDKFREQLQYLQADFDNFRKRMLKQQGETAERANEALIAKLLPVLDTIDLALAHEPNGSLEQVRSGLLDTLTKEGLERVEAVGQPFNPELHEAVAHEPGEGEATVSEELRAGYRWKGRVIRPSMVKSTGE